MRQRILIIATLVSMVIAVFGWVSPPAHADLPPNYDPVPVLIPLNPSHQGAVGSEFNQDCTGLPRPLNPGEVAWHFILPQSVATQSPTPTNVFNTLTVTFAGAGTVTLSLVSDFGPPSNAHAYIITSTDDTLNAGISTIGRLDTAPVAASNDPQFNLSHTCAAPAAETTTSTEATTTTTTNNASTTTTIGLVTTTTALRTTTTTIRPADPSSTTPTGVAPGTGALPTTGDSSLLPTMLATLATLLGVVLILFSRRRPRTDSEST